MTAYPRESHDMQDHATEMPEYLPVPGGDVRQVRLLRTGHYRSGVDFRQGAGTDPAGLPVLETWHGSGGCSGT